MKTLFIIAGSIWAIVGAGLLSLGVRLLKQANEGSALISSFSSYASVENTIVLLIAFSLVLGFFKGRFVLRRSAEREISRIRKLPEPSLKHLYSFKLIVLIGVMMLLGLSMRLFGFPQDIRGVIDVIVGFALLQGATTYFRAAVVQ
jgi:hypothetical protein